MHPPWQLVGVFALGLGSLLPAAADGRIPFVIPGDDASPSATNMAALSPREAGADGFVRIRDTHFFTDAGRLRFWGVNLTFGANFPEHADAEKTAAHLAKLGVNAVRLHHHETLPAPDGLLDPAVDGHRAFNAQQLERQDYFLNELHRHGIYANLNLHVGREFTEAEGFPRAGLSRATAYDKYLLYFEPRMREAFKVFCREYLTHENPYRHLRRVDDPGIAMIEITNENSFSKLGPDIAAALPEPYRGEFKKQWNAWLARRYADTATLRRTWENASEPLGATLVDSATWRSGAGTLWIHQSPGFPVHASYDQAGPQPDAPAVLIEPQGRAAELSQQELVCANLTLEPGRLYTLSFWAKAAAERTVFLDVSNTGPDNWNSVGLSEVLKLGPEWQRVHRVFRAATVIPGKARLCFKFGGNNGAFSLAGLTLRRGGGGEGTFVPDGQSIEAGTLEIPTGGWSEAAQADARRFMADTEQAFITDMVAFLKKDLGVRVPVTASQITYNTPKIIAATCDYADDHAYWQHPHFPRRQWDRADWTIQNTPMERQPDGDALLSQARWRLLDRPFTLSEWNIPDPNDYAASVVPFVAMVAGLQDWDGVFFFQYHGGRGQWDVDRIQEFFSFNGQPAKLALLTAFAPAFVRGDIAPLVEVAAGTTGETQPSTLGMSRRIGIDPKADRPTEGVRADKSKRLATPDGRVVWDAADAAHARVTLTTPATRAVWGLVGGSEFDLGGVKLSIGAVERDYAVVVLTSLDGRPLESAHRALLVAVGSAESLDVKWNAARTSVGRDWGRGPTQVNVIPTGLTLSRAGARVFALDGRGQRLAEVQPVASTDGRRFALGAGQASLWYEIEWAR